MPFHHQQHLLSSLHSASSSSPRFISETLFSIASNVQFAIEVAFSDGRNKKTIKSSVDNFIRWISQRVVSCCRPHFAFRRVVGFIVCTCTGSDPTIRKWQIKNYHTNKGRLCFNLPMINKLCLRPEELLETGFSALTALINLPLPPPPFPDHYRPPLVGHTGWVLDICINYTIRNKSSASTEKARHS